MSNVISIPISARRPAFDARPPEIIEYPGCTAVELLNRAVVALEARYGESFAAAALLQAHCIVKQRAEGKS